MIFGMKGTPYIYQGDEIGMTNVIYTESSRYQDIESVNFRKEKQELGWSEEKILSYLLRNSRDNARTPMQWNTQAHAGFTTGTPWMEANENYKKSLAGFDEITKLDSQDNNSSGEGTGTGTGGGADDAGSWKTEKVNVASSLADDIKNGDWSSVGKALGEKINKCFKFD